MKKILILSVCILSILGAGWKRIMGSSDAPLPPDKEVMKSNTSGVLSEPLFGETSSPIIGDIDGDRKSEVILSSSDGYLHVWENMDSEVLRYLLEWPQFHHDHQRTGLYGW